MIKIQLNDQVDLGGLIKMSGHSKFANIKHKKEKNDAAKGKIFTVIGRDYGVSDNAVRKWCDAEKLPRKSREIKSYSDEEWSKL